MLTLPNEKCETIKHKTHCADCGHRDTLLFEIFYRSFISQQGKEWLRQWLKKQMSPEELCKRASYKRCSKCGSSRFVVPGIGYNASIKESVNNTP